MKIIYKSHDGFLFLSNPFNNANYYLEILTIEEFKNLDSEKRLSLYFDLLQIKFRIFDFENFQNLKASTQELYKITAKKFFSFLCNIENFVNANDYQELLVFHENFDTSIVENKTEFDSVYRKEMEGLYKEISTIISKKNIVTDIKESAVFKTAVEFAKIDGIYSLINKKEFYHKNGTINSTALSIFLFKDTSCRTQIGVTINKELDDIDENIDRNNKNKHIYYSLKNNIILNTEFFNYLVNNRIETHPIFEEKIKFYKINKI